MKPNEINEKTIYLVTKSDLTQLLNLCLLKGNDTKVQYPEYLTIKQLSTYLNYSQPAIYKMVGLCEIPSYKLSGKLLFKKTEIDEWLLYFKQPTIKSRIDDLDNKCK